MISGDVTSCCLVGEYEHFGETCYHRLFFRWKRQSSETSVHIQQTARRRSLYDSSLKIYLCENLSSHLVKLLPSWFESKGKMSLLAVFC